MKRFLLLQILRTTRWFGLILFCCAGCQTKELTLAKVHIQQNDWNKAVIALEKTVAEDPRNAEAQFLLGQGYAVQQRFVSMNQAFAASLAASAQFEPAIKSLRQKYFSEYFNVGVKTAGENNFSAAREAFATAALVDPKQPEALGHLAYIQSQLGEFDKALELYQAALEIDSDHWEASVAIAEIHRQQKNYTKSLSTLEQALQKNPRQPQILSALAGVYDGLGKNDDALAAYQQALQIKPDDQELLLSLARLYSAKNDYSHAIQQFASVLSFDSNHFEANYHVGLGYLKIGKGLQKMASALEERRTTKFFAGADKKPKTNSPDDSLESARLNLEAMRNFKTALPFLLKAAALDTLHAGAYFNLGVGYTRLGEAAKAKEAFTRYEQLQEKR